MGDLLGRKTVARHLVILRRNIKVWISQITEWVDTNHLTDRNFVLCNKDDLITESSETLSIERLGELESKGKIRWPNISEKEIQEKSQGDLLSKGLVICQTTWFTVQYFARAKYKLPVTELKLMALAHAVLNGIVYFLWWNKAQNVACPVPVYLLSPQQEVVTHTTDSEETPGHDIISSIVCDPSYSQSTGENDEEFNINNY